MSGFLPVVTDDTTKPEIYDITGKRIETENISNLPAGIYISNGRKYIVR